MNPLKIGEVQIFWNDTNKCKLLKKLRMDLIGGMLATFRSRIF
jgi:hypothetical protein